jgi:hypothetical protein
MKTFDTGEFVGVSGFAGLLCAGGPGESAFYINSVPLGGKTKPNVQFVPQESLDLATGLTTFQLVLYVVDNIAAGEQLLLDYGNEYSSNAWTDRSWMTVAGGTVWALHDMFQGLTADPSKYGPRQDVKEAHALAAFPDMYKEGMFREPVVRVLNDIETAMMAGRGYQLETTEVNTKIARFPNCFGRTVAELVNRVVELELSHSIEGLATLNRRDKDGCLQAMFSERTAQDLHYDQGAGDWWNFCYKAVKGTDTAMGNSPNLDIAQTYQKAMELKDAEERAVAIAKCMIALDNEIKLVETEDARELEKGAYQLSKMSCIIHKGREGMGRRTWFGAVNLQLDVPAGQSMDHAQAYPSVNPTAAFTYRRRTMTLDKNGAENVLEMLRYSYGSHAWDQDGWPTPAQVAACIKVQTQQHTEQQAHKQPNNTENNSAPAHTLTHARAGTIRETAQAGTADRRGRRGRRRQRELGGRSRWRARSPGSSPGGRRRRQQTGRRIRPRSRSRRRGRSPAPAPAGRARRRQYLRGFPTCR